MQVTRRADPGQGKLPVRRAPCQRPELLKGHNCTAKRSDRVCTAEANVCTHLRPPGKTPSANPELENKANNEPAGIVDARGRRNGQLAIQHDGYVDIPQ